MSKALYLRKISAFLLALTLVVVPFCSFADDESVADPVQGSAPLSFTLEEWEFISQASDDDDRQLRQAAVLTATATTYDLDDIYSILSSVRMIDNSRYVWATFDESVWSEVHNVYNKLITNSYNNTYYSISELVAQLLSQFTSFSSFFYSPISGSASLWQLTDDIKTFVGLGLFDSQANPYLDLINSKIGTLTSSMTSGFNAVLSSVNSTTSAVNSTTNAVNATTNSVNNVVSSVDSLKSDLNSVSWTTYSALSYQGASFDINGTFGDLDNQSYPVSTYPTVFFKYSTGNFNSNDFILRFSLPLRQSGSTTIFDWINSIKLHNGIGYAQFDYYVDVSPLHNQLYVYLWNCELPRSGYFYLEFNFNNNWYWQISSSYSFKSEYLLSSQQDFYTVHTWLTERNQLNTFDLWKLLYASDDLVKSKQNQQFLEDQVLDDFTGSGSASAKVADAVDVKGVQGQVLGALGSSASASDLTTILNTSNPGSDNSFFSFFTQRVYNDLNNVQSTRGAVPEDDVYINLLDQRNDEYINLLGGSW